MSLRVNPRKEAEETANRGACERARAHESPISLAIMYDCTNNVDNCGAAVEHDEPGSPTAIFSNTKDTEDRSITGLCGWVAYCM